MKNKKKIVLIIAPHCDDEVLGCGGYISKFNNLKEFHVLYLTNANKGDPKKYSEKSIQLIRNEAKKSSKFLKIKNFSFENYPAPQLDLFPSNVITDKILKYLKLINPNEVFLPYYNDTHVDHQKIYLSAITALRPFVLKNKNIEKFFCYETLSETDYAIPNKKIFNPNYYVKLSKKNIDDKIKAMKIYKSQLKVKPHPRSTYGIKILASYRGLLSHTEYSEAFIIIRFYDN